MGHAAAMAWALFACCTLDVLTLPPSTGAVQVGARALVGALCFVFGLAMHLRQGGARFVSLYPPASLLTGTGGLRLVHSQPAQRMSSQVTRAGRSPNTSQR